jgi:hypothetical protein
MAGWHDGSRDRRVGRYYRSSGQLPRQKGRWWCQRALKKESGGDYEGEVMSIRLEAAIELARSILDGKTDYMTQSEEVYKVIALPV